MPSVQSLAQPSLWDQWPCLAALGGAVLITGIAKSGFGGGIGILAVPLVASAFPAEADRAIGVMLPILIAADVFAVAQHARHADRKHLTWTLTGGLTGIAVGLAVLWWYAESPRGMSLMLTLTIGAICLVFVALQAYRMVGGKLPRIPGGPWPGRASGVAGGLTSTLAHAAGPVMTIYYLERQLPKRVLVGTMVSYFFIVNWAKVPGYAWLGVLTWERFVEAMCFVWLVPVGALVGWWMLKRVPERPFTAIMYLATAVAGGRMVVVGVTGLLE
ncbi:MAG: sulfite exporter TauE/SafE family protein [Planctomycetota bacterium]